MDGISKGLAATGLRVGWLLAAPEVTSRMRDLIGHVGAWAPRPEQVATAKFLRNEAAVAAFRKEMNAAVLERLEALHAGFRAMKADGFPVSTIDPQGAIYLSLQLDVVSRSFDGKVLGGNETIRKAILEHAGLAVVPVQAFGLMEETGWFLHAYQSTWLPAALLGDDRRSSLTDALFDSTRRRRMALHFNKGPGL